MKKYNIGFTEQHGMTVELSKNPAEGVSYSFLEPLKKKNRLIRSPIKGFFQHYEADGHDLIEAILSPIFTKSRWIYYTACFQEAAAFNLLNIPVPRELRSLFLVHLMKKDNFKQLMFWSNAGMKTMLDYGGVKSKRILEKTSVIYPAIRGVSENLLHKPQAGPLKLLFSGAFFIKGGVNVVDAFEILQKSHPDIKLVMCCDEAIDFCTPNVILREMYLQKIKNNPGIEFRGRVPRELLLQTILPEIDIYLLPSYQEAFGFAILEAMAYRIPVISTNWFAIPEMVEHGKSGYLIDTSKYECQKLFRGTIVNTIPKGFQDYMTESLIGYLEKLIASAELRDTMGAAGLKIAQDKFSFSQRNSKMLEIYRNACS